MTPWNTIITKWKKHSALLALCESSKFTCEIADFLHSALDNAASQNQIGSQGCDIYCILICVCVCMCVYLKTMLLWRASSFRHQRKYMCILVHSYQKPWTNQPAKYRQRFTGLMFLVLMWLILYISFIYTYMYVYRYIRKSMIQVISKFWKTSAMIQVFQVC